MSALRLHRAPAYWLSVVWAYCLIAAAVAVAGAVASPWMGLGLRAGPDGSVEIVSATGPAAGLPTGARLLAIGPSIDGPMQALHAQDLMEEPDLLPDYAALDAFFTRQSAFAALLAGQQVVLRGQRADGQTFEATVRPQRRPIGALPVLFWFQLAVAIAGCVIASGVWVLRPDEPGARMFWITGLLCPAFAMPAAVYGTRELAIDGDLFALLSGLNHFSSAMWGAALVALLMIHPTRLVRPARLPWVFAFFGAWCLAGLARLLPDLDSGIRIPLMIEMLLALGFGAAQWRRTRRAPVDRAALRWLLLALLVGSALFIVTVVASTSLGWFPPLPQGYAFGFFLFVYAGIALGLRRYRLFDLDAWALRVLMWIAGAMAVLTVDVLLVAALGIPDAPALGAAVWLCGLLYFPARQWVWQRVVRREPEPLQAWIPEAVGIALEPSLQVRTDRWDELLTRLHDPLELTGTGSSNPTRTELGEEGLAMRIPACAGVPARLLRYPGRGRRLFSPTEREFVEALRALIDQAHRARDAHERGAKGERQRIAQDMHDDVGARLLMLIHRAPTAEQAELARAAMSDLRTALDSLDPTPVRLADALADWRSEASRRCEAAGVTLEWRADPGGAPTDLSPRHKAKAERFLRECLTNALKHARPARIAVEVAERDAMLHLRVRNDGVTQSPAQWTSGRGLTGMRVRLAEHGGALGIATVSDGEVEVSACLPIEAAETR